MLVQELIQMSEEEQEFIIGIKNSKQKNGELGIVGYHLKGLDATRLPKESPKFNSLGEVNVAIKELQRDNVLDSGYKFVPVVAAHAKEISEWTFNL